MKTILTIISILITSTLTAQCDNLNVTEKGFNITTTTPTKIKEFSLSKIYFSDYTPPASLIYLFLNADGTYIKPGVLKEMSKKSNVKIHFTDSTILNLRALIDLDYVGESIYTYHTVIFLNDEYIKQLSTKKVAYFELYHFKTILSGRKGNNLFDYLNCMISEEN